MSVGAEPVGHVRLGYARASTARQSLDAQLDSLVEAGVTRVFSEKISTRATKRPERGPRHWRGRHHRHEGASSVRPRLPQPTPPVTSST
ncbi:recombinase family protein [Streptomyces sp. NPDC056930]|uniref:recombinase family protein n=1 Tax=Streptomyces sp. NPDC056930 TaxID=3345967 RepID=UPI003631E000